MRRAAAVVAVLAALAFAGCGGSSTTDAGGADVDVETTDLSQGPRFNGGTVLPLEQAPDLGLRTIDGARLEVADLKGRVALVTFVYADCPDICQLIVDNMRLVKTKLGADGDRLALVAVSVDPKGDTPARVRRFLRDHQASGMVDYLVGTRPELEAVWKAWGVAAQEDFDDPARVEHSGVIWMLDAQGRRRVYYPISAIRANDILADARLLLDGA